jgi:glycosyltransferase involved in cell wall biosynthesis
MLERQPPDVVASHFALYAFPGLDLLKDHPLVVHFHGPWAHESRVEGERSLAFQAKAALERIVYRRGRLFVVLSQAFAGVLRDLYGVAEEDIRIVPGGVEVDRFDTGLMREEARERLSWPLDRPILLSVRRLYHRMGLENLIGAFREVHRRVPDALLYIAGKGPLAGDLHARITAEGLAEHVRLLGFVPDSDLPTVYRAADLSVVPTIALEGFGLITVESLAAGTPVLVTPVGGLPEVVRDLSPDLILPDADMMTMADRLTAILQGRVKLPATERCQMYARQRYDWPVIAHRTRRIYEEALA